ncbi:MAG: VCBS repeat-containing protein [Polyangiaceae bacterium]|nr:VCBS repeat-containing protein [Polyangiaceae bacterium]
MKSSFLGVAGLMLCLGGVASCRDVVFEDGHRVKDDHVLAGRTPALGGPTLTTAERSAGFFVSSNAALANLQTDLRTRMDLRLSLKHTVEAMLNGRVTTRDPRAAVPARSTSDMTLATPVSPGIDIPSILRNDATSPGELQALCAHPLIGPRLGGSCGTNPFKGLDDVPYDDLHVDLEAENITVMWDAPSQVSRLVTDPGSCTANPSGGVASACKAGFSCPTDGTGTAVAGACVGATCTTNANCVDPACAPFGGCNDGGITTGTCDTTAGRCTSFLDHVESESDGSATAPTLVVRVPFHLDLDPEDTVGSLIDINLQRLTVDFRIQPTACTGSSCRQFDRKVFDGYAGLFSDVDFSSAGADVRVISRLASREFSVNPTPLCFLPFAETALAPFFPAPPGTTGFACTYIAWEVIPPLLDKALTSAAKGMGKLLDPLLSPPSLSLNIAGAPSWLSVDPAHVFYDTLPTATSGSVLRALGAADGSWTDGTVDILARGATFNSMRVDLSGSPIPAACAAGTPGTSGFCTALCGGTATSCAMTNAKICFRLNGETAPCTGGLSLTAPTLTLVLGIAGDPSPATTVASITSATAPLPPAPNLAVLFDTAPAIAQTVQSIFTKPLEDAFGDGAFYSAIVNCPATGTRPAACPVGAVGPTFVFTVDTDRDGIADSEDACPTDPDTGNVNSDGDAFCDGSDLCPWTPSEYNQARYCSCDYDGDGCNNELLATPVSGAPASVPTSCSPGPGGIFDERPSRSDHGSDEDHDGITADCDPDDDGDGVPDTTDNCPDVANPTQADYDSNGVGDACDPLCWGAGAPCPSPEDPGAFGHIDTIDFGRGIGLIPGCLADGPGCWGFFRFDCLNIGGSCFDDVAIDRFQDGLMSSLVSMPELRSAIPIGDLDGDGFADLIAASPKLGLTALSGQSGKPIWTTQVGAPGFGASMILAGNLIAVGAPDESIKGQEGAVYWFDTAGKALGKPVIGKEPGERLGASLGYVNGVVFAGAPGKPGESYGRLYSLAGPGKGLQLALDGKSLQVPIGGTAPVGLKMQGKKALVFGAPSYGSSGAVLAFEQTGAGVGKLLIAYAGEKKSELGSSVSAAADFDGDGALEVAIGAPGYAAEMGGVYFLNGDGKLLPSGLWGPKGSRFGQSVTSMGDLNGDKRAELGVTLPGYQMANAQTPGAELVLGFDGKK